MALRKDFLLLPYLAEVCREHREAHNVHPIQVAAVAGFEAATSISRTFEEAKSWSGNPDAVVMAYATATEQSVFDLWDEAIRRARKAKADASWLEGQGPS